MTETTSAKPDYSLYWKAWGVLLAITLLMVFIRARPVLIVGMTLKGGIIAWFFMHLRSERRDFVFYVLFGMVAISLILFGLIATDGMAM